MEENIINMWNIIVDHCAIELIKLNKCDVTVQILVGLTILVEIGSDVSMT